jgi:hypothetical protein
VTSGNYTSPTAWAVLFVVLLVRPADAWAFTFSDGTQQACWASNEVVGERYHPPGDPTAPAGFIGFTHFDAGAGWTIDWNVLMLSSLPSYAHDFAFFHECAHAKTRSFDEVQANCLALLDMRAAGRAGRDIEAKLATYHKRLGDMGPQYGQGREFWAKTLACANAAAASTKSSAKR